MFCIENKNSNHKNDPFDSNWFIWNSNDIREGNSHIWHQKYSLLFTKVFGFVVWRVTSKIIWIESAESSWSYVKTTKSGNILTLGSDVNENQSIGYTFDYIK